MLQTFTVSSQRRTSRIPITCIHSIIHELSVVRYSLMNGGKGSMTILVTRRTSSLGNLTSSRKQDARMRRRNVHFLHSHSRLDPLQTPQTRLTVRSSSRRFCQLVWTVPTSCTSIVTSVMSVRSVVRDGIR